MFLHRKAVRITGPLTPEVQQQLNLEKELGKIKLDDEVDRLQSETSNAVSILDTSRIKIGDLVKRLNELDSQSDSLTNYLEASYKPGANIDFEKWRSLLQSITGSAPESGEDVRDQSKLALDDINSKREVIIKELIERNEDVKKESNIYLSDLMDFDEKVKRYFFKESKGFFSTLAELDEDYAINLIDRSDLDALSKEYAKLAIEQKIPVKLTGAGIDIIHDIAKAIEDTIKNKQAFIGNVKADLIELLETYDEIPSYDIESLTKINEKISNVKNTINKNVSYLTNLKDEFNKVRSKIDYILKTYDEHIIEVLEQNIDKIAESVVNNVSDKAPEGTADQLKQIVLSGLQEETKGETPMSLDPKDTESILTYIAKKGKIQDKYLLALVYNHYVINKLQEDLPELAPFKKLLPQGFQDVPNTLYGWVFNILNAINSRKSFKETLRELMLDRVFKDKAIPTFNERYKLFKANDKSISKNESLAFQQVDFTIDFFKELFTNMSTDFDTYTQLQKLDANDYSSFMSIENTIDELQEKNIRLKEISSILNSDFKKIDAIESMDDIELKEIIESLSELSFHIFNEIGDEIDLSGFSGLEKVSDVKNYLKNNINTVLKDINGVKTNLNRYLKASNDGMKVYRTAKDNLDMILYSYATGNLNEKDKKFLTDIEDNASKVSDIITNKTKEIANTLLNFGIKNIEPEPVEEFYMSLNLKNLYLRGASGIRETTVPTGFTKKQELSKERIMNYKVNDLVTVSNVIGLYRIIAIDNAQVSVVSEDELQSGAIAKSEVINASEISKATDMSISIGDKIIDENYGECIVTNTAKENFVDIQLSSGVKIFDYPLHKLASKEELPAPATLVHQCHLDNGWSITSCCAFSKLVDSQFQCGYKEAVQKVKDKQEILNKVSSVSTKEEKKFLTLEKISSVLSTLLFSDLNPLLKVASNIDTLDPTFTPISIGSIVMNRSLTRTGNITKYNEARNTYEVSWSDGSKGQYWQQELINKEAKELIRK